MDNDISQRTALNAAGVGVGGPQNQRGSPWGFSSPPSPLVAMSLVAPIVGGPVGSVAAIVFGWAARHEPAQVLSPRRRILAAVGMAMGFVFTCMWAAIITHVTMTLEKRRHAEADVAAVEAAQAVASDAVTTNDMPSSVGSHEPAIAAPRETTVRHEGQIVVVDIGTSVPSLSEEMAKERAEASRAGDQMVVMTTRGACVSCQHFTNTLRHPLMQAALGHVRLVRIDADAFDEDLSNLKIPRDNLPGFFLLAPDLYPRDGIDNGEWGPDSAMNVAPVLNAFVRGKYATRRRAWQPVSENRLRL